MSVHDVLVPLRFLALLGHFLATLLCLYAVRDNVLVALPFTYDAVSMENGLQRCSARGQRDIAGYLLISSHICRQCQSCHAVHLFQLGAACLAFC